MRRIGLAIPTYERDWMLFESFYHVQHDPRIGAITVVDDHSSIDVYDAVAARSSEKISLFRNARNFGCYVNKRLAVGLSDEEWVIQLDSDNAIDGHYLDALFAIPEWDRETLYVPTFAKPAFDYRAYAGLTVTRANVAEYFDQPRFSTALNTGNFFVNRDAYMDAHDGVTDPMAADSMYFCYCWLKSGRKIHFTPGLEYLHRVHNGNYVAFAERSKDFFQGLELAMRQLR